MSYLSGLTPTSENVGLRPPFMQWAAILKSAKSPDIAGIGFVPSEAS
jgi:hypothetical protein